MTLFESTIRKLNIPRFVMDDIVAIRNICMEAEQPAQQQAAQPAKQEQSQQQPAQQQQQQPQNANQQQPQQNAQNNSGAQQEQGQQASQDKPNGQAQQQKAQANQKIPDNIQEDQVDAGKLMKAFNNYLEQCKQKLQKKIEMDFGEDGKTIVQTVLSHVSSKSPINFDEEISPYLMKNGKLITDKNVINDIRGRLEKYFGVTFMNGQAPVKKQEQPNQQNGEQENKKQEQPAK